MGHSNLASSQNSSHTALHSIYVNCILFILPEEGTPIAAIMRPAGAIYAFCCSMLA